MWVLVVTAAVAGWFLPELYYWTGADQSRSAPAIRWVAVSILVVDLLLILLLAWLHFTKRVSSDEKTPRLQFSILHMLCFATCAAILMTTARFSSFQIASFLFQGMVIAFGIWMAIQFRWTRWRILWIATLQLVPFLWVVRTMADFGPAFLLSLGSLPTLVLMIFFRKPNDAEMWWILTSLTTVEFGIGLWFSYFGPKRVLTYGVVLLTLSVFSSFVFYGLMQRNGG